VTLNGRVVERVRMKEGSLTRDFRVDAVQGRPNVLELSTDRTLRPPNEARELGICLRNLAWGPS